MVLVFAALAIAVPFCLLPSSPTKGELVYLLNRVKSGAKSVRLNLFVHPSLLKLATAGAKEAGVSPKHIYTLGGEGKRRSHRDLSSLIENMLEKGIPKHPAVPVEKNTLAYLIFSSGTSGLPKRVFRYSPDSFFRR